MVLGPIRQEPFAASDGTYFATPWPSGGGWPAGTTSVLHQTTIDFPAGHSGELLARLEAIWARCGRIARRRDRASE